jgi:hypothetical protein
LRAIGDFNYVGFFKKIKHTKFGKNDTKYFSPLCLTIGVLTIILELINKKLLLTGVWQNGGISAKLSICTSINISANLNICTSNPPLRQAPKR